MDASEWNYDGQAATYMGGQNYSNNEYTPQQYEQWFGAYNNQGHPSATGGQFVSNTGQISNQRFGPYRTNNGSSWPTYHQ